MPKWTLFPTFVLVFAVRAPASDRPSDVETLLRTAPVVAAEDVGWGVTRPQKVTLEADGRKVKALWKPLARGRRNGIWENPEGEAAAYELSKLLGLDMVPPTVMREIDGRTGSLQLWVEDAKLFADAADSAPRSRDWQRAVSRMRLFDHLICNLDRNGRNYLVSSSWDIVLIDHSQAFLTRHPFYPDVTECLAPEASEVRVPERIDRDLFARLRSLDRAALEAAFDGLLSGSQIASILDRRDGPHGPPRESNRGPRAFRRSAMTLSGRGRAVALGIVLLCSGSARAGSSPSDARVIRVDGRISAPRFAANGGIVYQASRGTSGCDQIYSVRPGAEPVLVSPGTGRASGPAVLPHGDGIVFSSTHFESADCPERPSARWGYVWSLGASDLFRTTPSGELERLTDALGFDGEASVSLDGQRIAFTSSRDGDYEIYVMDVDGGNARRLTHDAGYDGQPAFSPDGRQIVFAGHDTEARDDPARHRALLAEGLLDPSRLELYVMNVDGTGKRPLTRDGGANFAPSFHPDGQRVLFSSNKADPRRRNFDLYVVRIDGGDEERLTSEPSFEAYPFLREDGSQLLFVSNRDGREPEELHLFIADWPLR